MKGFWTAAFRAAVASPNLPTAQASVSSQGPLEVPCGRAPFRGRGSSQALLPILGEANASGQVTTHVDILMGPMIRQEAPCPLVRGARLQLWENSRRKYPFDREIGTLYCC
jgi:hypothetical protein